jgi:hypothetical protein
VDGLAAIASSPLGSSALPASRKQKRWREPLQSTRIRRSQWEDLISRAEGGVLRGLMFLHLRADLGGGAQDWIGCNDPQENEAPEPAGDSLTSYGIRRDVRTTLARLRTDLDSFSSTESAALMTSGYRMATHEFSQCLPTIPTPDQPPHDWAFLTNYDAATHAARRPASLSALKAGSHRWLRPARRFAAALARAGQRVIRLGSRPSPGGTQQTAGADRSDDGGSTTQPSESSDA